MRCLYFNRGVSYCVLLFSSTIAMSLSSESRSLRLAVKRAIVRMSDSVRENGGIYRVNRDNVRCTNPGQAEERHDSCGEQGCKGSIDSTGRNNGHASADARQSARQEARQQQSGLIPYGLLQVGEQQSASNNHVNCSGAQMDLWHSNSNTIHASNQKAIPPLNQSEPVAEDASSFDVVEQHPRSGSTLVPLSSFASSKNVRGGAATNDIRRVGVCVCVFVLDDTVLSFGSEL